MPRGLHPPIDVLLTWKLNYVNSENRGPGLVILVSVLLAICYIVVGLRLWARLQLVMNAGVDDALIVFNMVRKQSRS